MAFTCWLVASTGNKEALEDMKSFRVYVANNANQVFNLKDKQTIAIFTINVIEPLIKKRCVNLGGVVTIYYWETDILLFL